MARRKKKTCRRRRRLPARRADGTFKKGKRRTRRKR
jgi:hypothetical protein